MPVGLNSSMDAVAIAIRLLLDAPTITAAVGNRITTFDAVQGSEYPNIVLYPTSSGLDETLDGKSEPWDERFSVQARADSYKDAYRVGGLCLDVLSNFTGIVADRQVLACYLTNSTVIGEDASNVARRVLDMRMFHSKAA